MKATRREQRDILADLRKAGHTPADCHQCIGIEDEAIGHESF